MDFTKYDLQLQQTSILGIFLTAFELIWIPLFQNGVWFHSTPEKSFTVQCYFRDPVLHEPAAQKRHAAGRSHIWNAGFNLSHHFQVCIQAGNEHKRRGICSWHTAHGDIMHTHTQIESLQCALTWQSKDYINKIGRKLLWVSDKVLVLAGCLAFSLWRLAALHLDLWVRRPWESRTGSMLCVRIHRPGRLGFTHK